MATPDRPPPGPAAGDEPDRGREHPAAPFDQAVQGFEILEALAALPISTWNYKADEPHIRHLGPMAQDFAAAFGLGGDDRTISLIDANGVVMVAIQALYRRVKQLEDELAELRR